MRNALRSTILAAAGLLLLAPAGMPQTDDAPYGDIILAEEEAFLDFAAEPEQVVRLLAQVLSGDGISLPDVLEPDGWNQVGDLWFRTERLPFKEGVWTRFRLRVGDFDGSDDLVRAETILTRMATLLDTGRASDPPPAEPLVDDTPADMGVDSSYVPRAVGDDRVVYAADQVLYGAVDQQVVYVPEIVTVYAYLPAWSFGWYGCAPYYDHYGSYGSYGYYGRYAYGYCYGSYGYGYGSYGYYGYGYGWPYGSWYGYGAHGAYCGCAWCGDITIIVEDDDGDTGNGSGDGSGDTGDVADAGDDDGQTGGGDVARGDDAGPKLGRRSGTSVDGGGRTRTNLDPDVGDDRDGGRDAGAGGGRDAGSGGLGAGGVATRSDPPAGDDGGPVVGEPTRRPRSLPVARRPLGEATTSRTPTVRRAPTGSLVDGGSRSTPTVRRPVTSTRLGRSVTTPSPSSTPTVSTRSTPRSLPTTTTGRTVTRLPTTTGSSSTSGRRTVTTSSWPTSGRATPTRVGRTQVPPAAPPVASPAAPRPSSTGLTTRPSSSLRGPVGLTRPSGTTGSYGSSRSSSSTRSVGSSGISTRSAGSSRSSRSSGSSVGASSGGRSGVSSSGSRGRP